MSAALRFRRGQSGEATRLTALCVRSKAHWGYDEDFLKRSAEDLTVQPEALHRGLVLVGSREQGGSPVAVSALTDLGRQVFDLALFFLAPELIGKGYGRPLFEATLQLARDKGGTRLLIEADPNAEGFYRKMGARRIGEAPSSFIEGRVLPQLDYRL